MLNKVRLKAKTPKAKKLLDKWGTDWYAIGKWNNKYEIVSVDESRSTMVPMDGSVGWKSYRWLHTSDDPEFEIVKERVV